MAPAATGSDSSRPATPSVPRASMVEKPKGTPRMCGSAARKPKLAPVAVATVVFGPGVNDPTSENTTKAQSCAGSMACPATGKLYPDCLVHYRYSSRIAGGQVTA